MSTVDEQILVLSKRFDKDIKKIENDVTILNEILDEVLKRLDRLEGRDEGFES